MSSDVDADVISFLHQGNVKKSKKKLILNKKIFISSKFSAKMSLMIILKVTKNKDSTPSLKNTILEKPQVGSN